MNPVMAEEVAEQSVARAGHSEHETGLAIDLNGVLETFADTEAYRWLQRHAYEYGFVLRYPEGKEEITGIRFEPWHFRYVGKEHARKMRLLNLCLEEYISYCSLQKQHVSPLNHRYREGTGRNAFFRLNPFVKHFCCIPRIIVADCLEFV